MTILEIQGYERTVMANYIRTLQSRVEQLEADKAEALEGLNELHRYLTSEKFYADPSVNVSDIFLRMEPVRTALFPTTGG